VDDAERKKDGGLEQMTVAGEGSTGFRSHAGIGHWQELWTPCLGTAEVPTYEMAHEGGWG